MRQQEEVPLPPSSFFHHATPCTHPLLPQVQADEVDYLFTAEHYTAAAAQLQQAMDLKHPPSRSLKACLLIWGR